MTLPDFGAVQISRFCKKLYSQPEHQRFSHFSRRRCDCLHKGNPHVIRGLISHRKGVFSVKFQCYIPSLKQGEKNVPGEAAILTHLGDNDYLAEYNSVKCCAIYNPFCRALFCR